MIILTFSKKKGGGNGRALPSLRDIRKERHNSRHFREEGKKEVIPSASLGGEKEEMLAFYDGWRKGGEDGARGVRGTVREGPAEFQRKRGGEEGEQFASGQNLRGVV